MADIPNPSPKSVAIWLKNGIDRKTLHDVGWQEANKRFHGITRAARPYILANYKTPEEQEAAFDGLTLALFTLAHFEDIKKLDVALTKGHSTSQPTHQLEGSGSSGNMT